MDYDGERCRRATFFVDMVYNSAGLKFDEKNRPISGRSTPPSLSRLWLVLSLLSIHVGGSYAYITRSVYSQRRNQKRSWTQLPGSLGRDQDETTDVLHDIQQKLDHQQKQINQLINVIQRSQQFTTDATLARESVQATSTQQSTDSVSNHAAPSQPTVTPVKVMLFIDGTWLFYSIYQRESDNCPICQRFGPIWPLTHMVDWQALNRIVARCLMEEHHSASASSSPVRPISIVRASVFTSYKADTPTTSHRYKMFEELRQANFDVHMMETVGKSEKCVDIQLAVEMLHFATVPHAYDVAVLLTGDKDFMPAMIRTRQKGRQVALVSMRRGCNQALVKTDMLKDFDVIWLDDHIEELIIPKPTEEMPQGVGSLSIFTVLKVLRDFIGKGEVSSRECGRFLKSIRVGETGMLEELKTFYGGIYMFLAVQGSKIFSVSFRDEDERETLSRSYRIGVKPDADSYLLEMAKQTNFSDAEKEFFETYSFPALVDRMTYSSALGFRRLGDSDSNDASSANLSSQHAPDYASYTLSQLREVCRDLRLPVSGVKSAVLERILSAQQGKDEPHGSTETIERPRSSRPGQSPSVAHQVPETASQHLLGLLMEYIHASGGKASSRDVGRYLAANRSSPSTKRAHAMSALQELKALYGSLASFVQAHADVLLRLDDVDTIDGDINNYAFSIGLQQGVVSKL